MGALIMVKALALLPARATFSISLTAAAQASRMAFSAQQKCLQIINRIDWSPVPCYPFSSGAAGGKDKENNA
jgi:hypothetical protein